MEQHKHNWQVIVSIKMMPWDDFMRFRGGDIDKDAQWTEQMQSHKVYCPECKEVKTIE